MPLDKPLDEIDESDLEKLIFDRVAECKTIEYKQALPGKDDDRKEFLADASSFANTAGGHLIYGIREEAGQPVDLCGLPDGTNGDSEILALEGSIRNCIAPRVPGVHSKAVSIRGGRVAIVIRIPKSFASPHMVTYKGSSRFYSRNSNGKYPLDVGEIRAAFLLSESAAERCRDFRLDRLSKIQADETPLPMAEGPKVALHICPIGLASQRVALDSDTVNKLLRTAGSLSPVCESGYNNRYNFDGFLTYTTSESAGLASAYLQVFRSGCIETVNHRILKYYKAIPSIDFEDGVIKSLPRYFEALKVLNIETPVFVMLSLVGVLGFHIATRHSIGHQLNEIDRQTLICPEVLIEDFNSNVEAQMKPAFDAVWNAAGWPGSLNYQGNKWVPAN